MRAIVASLCFAGVLLALPVVALADNSTPAPITAASLAGDYAVDGLNQKGVHYTGQASIRVTGNVVDMTWELAGGQTIDGHGSINDNAVVVQWGAAEPVIYRLGSADGVLHGTWAKGQGKEDLVPVSASPQDQTSPSGQTAAAPCQGKELACDLVGLKPGNNLQN
jgi:hypothetical protein